MAKPSALVASTCALLGFLLLLSCTDIQNAVTEPSTPSAGGTGTGPFRVQGQSFSGSVGISNQFTNAGEISLPTYSYETLVQITVSGLVDQVWNSPPSGMNPQPQAGDLNTRYDLSPGNRAS